MTEQELLEKIATITKTYNEEILATLQIDDRTFFKLPIFRRERYVELTKGLPDQILALIKEGIPDGFWIDPKAREKWAKANDFVKLKPGEHISRDKSKDKTAEEEGQNNTISKYGGDNAAN